MTCRYEDLRLIQTNVYVVYFLFYIMFLESEN